MDRVSAGSSSWLTVTFYGADGSQSTPTSVVYSVRCLTTGQDIQTDTSISAANPITIHLTPTVNSLSNPGNYIETREVTVTAAYGAGDQTVARYEYQVVR